MCSGEGFRTGCEKPEEELMSRVLGASLAFALVCTSASFASAQTTSSSTTQTKNFEVIAVNGNDLVVRLPEGTREMNVPDDFRFTVNGQSMSVHELQPGMKGSATITTRTQTTPVTVTEVKNGQVAMASGGSIYVRTGGDVKMFNQADIEKRGIKLMRDGRPAQVSDFRPGDQLSAVFVTAAPPRVVTEREVQATLAKAAPASAAAPTPTPAPARSAPAVAPASAQAPRPAPVSTEARALPKTASPVPTVGLLGALALALASALTLRRRLAD